MCQKTGRCVGARGSRVRQNIGRKVNKHTTILSRNTHIDKPRLSQRVPPLSFPPSPSFIPMVGPGVEHDLPLSPRDGSGRSHTHNDAHTHIHLRLGGGGTHKHTSSLAIRSFRVQRQGQEH